MRGVLVALVAVVGMAGLEPASGGQSNAFPHGVAARAKARSAMLWTRAASPGVYEVTFSRRRDLSGGIEIPVVALEENDNTIKQVVRFLVPDSRYFYRFSMGPTQTSALGTFRTLPTPKTARSLELSISGDSDVLWQDPPEDGPAPARDFAVLDRIREERSDLFIYMGDTIYSDSETGAPLARTLEEKWAKYKANRLPATKALLRKVSTWALWDDHEVVNDFDGARLARTNPSLLAAGREAFTDYFPVAEKRFYRKVDYGPEVDMIFLDERSYRTRSADGRKSPCRDEEGNLDLAPTMPQEAREELGLGPVDPACRAHVRDPDRTMLGETQLRWLKNRLENSSARWKLVINEVPITQLFVLPYDRWEGYQAERNEILSFIGRRDIKGVVFLTTDLHANAGARVYRDITNEDADPITYEMITGPIQTCTLDCEVDKITETGAGGEIMHGLLRNHDLIDTDCVHMDHYAYGTATIPRRAVELTLRWKSHSPAEDGPGGVPVPGCDPVALRPAVSGG